jgi:hypothetical protein
MEVINAVDAVQAQREEFRRLPLAEAAQVGAS